MAASTWTEMDKRIFHRMRSEGCTYGEIARRLGKNKDTVSKYAKRIGAPAIYGGRKKKDDSKCWSCALANGTVDDRTCEQCPWAKNLTPRQDWTAEAVVYKSYNGGKARETINWRVIQCPSFIPDAIAR